MFNQKIAKIASSLLFLCTVWACSSAPAPKTGVVPNTTTRDYALEKGSLEKSPIISPGFTLKIRHSADETISGLYTVNVRGIIKLPYKREILAAGITTEALAAKIDSSYKNLFKTKNNVSVEISSRDYLVEIRGLVKKPGIHSVKLDSTIEEMIALGGGLQGEGDAKAGAKPEFIRIVIPGFMSPKGDPVVRWVSLAEYFSKYDIRNEILWRGGEELFFQVTGDPDAIKAGHSQTVKIMGEVRNPGEYAILPGKDMHAYLEEAGGPTTTADLSEVTIVQRSLGVSTTVDIKTSTTTVNIMPGDLILVKSTQSKPSWWERMGGTMIGLGGLAVAIVTLIIAL